MGFIMDGLDAEDYDRTYSDRDLTRRILAYFRPKLGAMFLVAAMIVLVSAAQAALPLLASKGVDAIQDGTIAGVGPLLVVGILLAGALSWAFNFVRQWYSARVTGDVVLRLREDAFDAVLERDLSFYDETPSGRIVSRVTSDTDDFATVSTLTMDLISQVLMVGFVTVLLFLRSVELALLTLLVAPVVMGMALLFRRLARSSTRRAQRSLSRVNANLQETMGGIAVAKNFRQEQQVYDEFRPVNEQSYRVTLRQGFVFSAIFPLLFLVAGLATVALVQLGGTAVLVGGRLVPVPAGRVAVLDAADLHRRLLVAVPAGPVGLRAGLRPDRRPAPGRADRLGRPGQAGRAHRVRRRHLRLRRGPPRAPPLRPGRRGG
ncbi:ABC transporter ATP-binding protein [Nonomuraea sp. NPDC001023]|uniref:ABC transporter ATP-binding protein n=1 Tax=unclassified Nonomuraea TaxID=2593643 RepID=UPI0033307C7E